MAAEQPTAMLMPSPTGEYQVLGEIVHDAERGRPVAQQIRQLIFKRSDSSLERVPFPRAWTSEQVRRVVQERHLEEAKLIEIYLDADEGPETESVRMILKEVLGKVEARCWYGKSEPGSVSRVEIAAGITTKYLRAVAKVAFHYFLWVSKLCRGNEREFAAVREFIRDGVGDGRAFVQIREGPFIPQLRKYVPKQVSHFLLSEQNRTAVGGSLQFFVGPDHLPPTFHFRLGSSPSRIDAQSLSAHRVWYFGEKVNGYDGEIETIDVTKRRIIVPGRLK